MNSAALVVGVLPLDRLLQPALLHVLAAPREGEAEALAVVEPQVVAIVGVAVQRIAVFSQRGDQGITVLRLVVHDDAVEVEENAGDGHVD